jgi:hypothetical protein
MYKKIQTTEARETFIVDALKAKYGQDADNILKAVYEKHPPSDKNATLDEILGNVPIHQGIQNLIVDAETREASVISAFCAKFGDDAKELVISAAHDHGIECGTRAVKERGSSGDCTASKAFELIQSYLCDGMPCDRGAQAQSEEDDRTTWDHTECVHEQYWKGAGASFETMCDMLNSWIAGFGEGTNPKIKYKREKAIATGDSMCLSIFEIS